MSNINQTNLHPVEKAGALESRLRQLLQNPKRILEKYVQPGMTILDLGCGTGYFTIEIARLLGDSGKVFAADVQKGMLEILRQKLNDSKLQHKIQIHNCPEDCICLTEKFDFILAFYTFHEMKYLDNIIAELKTLIKPETKILIAEQQFHVSKYTFKTLIQKMEVNGFIICERPKMFFTRTY